MQRYVARKNVELFQRMLAGGGQSLDRPMLERLLAEARRELSGVDKIWSWTCPHLGLPDEIGAAAEDILDQFVEETCANYGSLHLWDGAERSLYLIAHCNFDRASAERFARVRDGDGTVCSAACTSHDSIIVEDIEQMEVSPSLRDWARATSIRAIWSTPVFNTKEPIGLLSTHHASPKAPSSEDNNRMAGYAERFGQLLSSMTIDHASRPAVG
jgi:GAF domain-containing protein